MVKRKGLELPVNVLVVLAVAVIVLIAIVAVFMGVFQNWNKSQEFNTACNGWKAVDARCTGDVPNDVCQKAVGYVSGITDDSDCDTDDGAHNIKSACNCLV